MTEQSSSKIDYINNTITNTLLTNFINTSSSFTKQLTTVLLMSSIDELKKIITDFFTYIRNNYKDLFYYIRSLIYFFKPPLSLIFYLINKIYSKPKSIVKYKPELVNDVTPINSVKIVYLDTTPTFFNSLINYIKSNKGKIQYDENYNYIDIIDRYNITKKRKIISVFIEYNEMKINIIDQIIIDTDLNDNLISFMCDDSKIGRAHV